MNIKQSHELKQLQSRKAKLEVDVEQLRQEKATVSDRFNNVCIQLRNLEAEIRKLSETEPVVTEHALLRYIERKLGLNLDEIKAEILTERNIDIIKAMVSCKIKAADGTQLVVKDRTVVSII